MDAEVEEGLFNTKVGYARRAENSTSLQEAIDLLGHNSIKVVGLSDRKFLLRTELETGWKYFEVKDLDMLFSKLRDFSQEDLVLERTVWIQSYGLPMNALLEENLKGYTNGLGEWLSWSYQKDKSNDFFNPIICVSTTLKDFICEDMTVLVRGKHYKVIFEEITNQNKLVDKIAPMQLYSGCNDFQINVNIDKPGHTDFSSLDHLDQSVSKKVDTSGEASIVNGGISGNGNSKEVDENGKFNSFRDHVSSELEIASIQVTQDKGIGSSSPKTGLLDTISDDSTIVSNSVDLEGNSNSHNSLCKDLQLLKMSGVVGRPKKKMRGVKNPFDFGSSWKKFGKRKTRMVRKPFPTCSKMKNKELKLTTIAEEFSLVDNDEAMNLIECAESLGLSVIKDKEDTIKQVHSLLQDGKL